MNRGKILTASPTSLRDIPANAQSIFRPCSRLVTIRLDFRVFVLPSRL